MFAIYNLVFSNFCRLLCFSLLYFFFVQCMLDYLTNCNCGWRRNKRATHFYFTGLFLIYLVLCFIHSKQHIVPKFVRLFSLSFATIPYMVTCCLSYFNYFASCLIYIHVLQLFVCVFWVYVVYYFLV